MESPGPHLQRDCAALGWGPGIRILARVLPLAEQCMAARQSSLSRPCGNAFHFYLSTCLLSAFGNWSLSSLNGFLRFLFCLHFYLKWLMNYIKCFLSISWYNHFKFLFTCIEATIFDLQKPMVWKGVRTDKRRRFLTSVEDRPHARSFPSIISLSPCKISGRCAFLGCIWHMRKLGFRCWIGPNVTLNIQQQGMCRVWRDLKFVAIFFFFLTTDHLPVDFSC